MISIIVPVYNVEKFLDTCVNTIVNQTYKDIEILLIDDGSKDSSGKLCDEWALKDERIRVIHKENNGLMSAWKTGVMNAKGDYIGFVDSDDWIDEDMYSMLVQTMEKYDVDLVCCGLIKEYSNGTQEKESILFDKRKYEKDEIINSIYPKIIFDKSTHNRSLAPNRVTKLFKRQILLKVMNLCDEKVSIGEDLVTSFAYFLQISSFFCLNDFYPYHYRIHSSSMIQKFSKDNYEKTKKLCTALLNVNNETTYNFENQIYNDFIQLMMRFLDNEILFSRESKKELKDSFLNIYSDSFFQLAIKQGEPKNLSFKYRMYLFLLKKKWYNLLIFIRKAKKV